MPDPQRYEKDIQAFREFDASNALPKNPALFVGSSTIVKWKTADAFPGFSVINRGFGGNVIEDVLYYYKDVIGNIIPLPSCSIATMTSRAATAATTPSTDHAGLSQGSRGLSQGAVCLPEHEARAQLRLRQSGGGCQAIDRFNELAKAQAKKDSGFKYFDMDAPVRDASGKVPGDLFLDGEHFNDKGYALINPAMEKLLVSLHVPRSH